MFSMFDAQHQLGMEEGLKKGIEQGIQQGIQQGIEQGVEQGRNVMRDELLDLLAFASEEDRQALLSCPVEERKDLVDLLMTKYSR